MSLKTVLGMSISAVKKQKIILILMTEEEFSMSIEFIKSEVLYYCGKKVSNQEAEEIKAFAEDCPGASLSEIISDYYGC